MPLQIRRGTDLDRLSITPAVGEPIWTTDTNKLYIGDGSTVGGVEYIPNQLFDSASAISLIDSAYIQARQVDIYRDSGFVTNIIDSAYIVARTPPSLTIREVDSADNVNKTITSVSAINFDNWTGFQVTDLGNGEVKVALGSGFKYISVDGQDDIVAIGEDTLTVDAGTNVTLTTNAVTKALTINATFDSAEVAAIVDSSYVQARQTPQDFAYSSLTGAPTNVSSFTNDAGYTTYDSANATGQITAAIDALINGAPGALDTLNELAAALGDDANFATTVTNAIAALPDSSEVQSIATTLVDSAYVQARQTAQDFAYSSLTGAPTNVSSFTNDANYLDSNTVTDVIDATYINSLVTATDSAAVINIITETVDSAYVTARIPEIPSVTVSGTAPASPTEGDLWYDNVTTGQLYTYVGTSWLSTAGLTTLQFSSVGDLSDVDITTAAPTNGQFLAWDSANSKFVPGSETPQDFAYSSLTGAPTNVSSFTNDAGYITAADALDSAEVVTLVDSAYVQSRQTPQDFAYSSLTGAPTNVSSFTNDAGYITAADALDSVETQALIDAAVAALVDTAPATLDTLNELAAALGDDANFATTVTNAIAALPDSSEVQAIATTLVDSAYVQARQTPQDFAYSSLTGAPTNVSSFTNDANYLDSNTVTGVIDATYINSLVTATDSAAVINIVTDTVDSAYVTARIPEIPSVTVSGTAPASPSEGDLWYDNVTTGQLYTYVGTSWLSTAGLTTLQFSSIADLADVDSSAPTDGQYLTWNSATSQYVPTTLDAGTDSATVASIVTSTVDSAYVQTRQTPQDFAYSSLTGAPTTVSTFTNDANYLDSNTVIGVIDATYVQANQTAQDFAYSSLTGAPTNVSDFSNDANYIATGDSAALASLTTTGNVVIGGNLQVNGTTVTVNTTDLDVTDNMIYMNAGESAGSPTASIDVGWAANVNDQGSYYHVGLFRDATDQTFKVYHQYTPEPDAAVQINTGDASFALAPFAASTLTGVYQGFDSDVTAAGLATQTYVTSTIDSAYIQARVDSAYVNGLITIPSGVTVSGTAPASPTEGDLWYDNVTTGQLYTYVGTSWLSTAGLTTLQFSSIADLSDVDSSAPTEGQYLAWNSATSQYVPTTLAAGTDSGTVVGIVTSTVDSAYVQARQTAQDFAYSSLTGAPTNVSSFTNDAGYLTTAIDSTGVTSLIDAAVAALVDTAPSTLDTLNELAAALGDDANFATTVTNAIAALPDSAEVAAIVQSYGYTTYDSSNTLALVDSSYVQSRQTPQDFAYASLTGAPTNVSSFTNDANYLDSSTVAGVIDSAYINGLVTIPSGVVVSGTAPVSPTEGDLWYDDVTTGELYVYENGSWTSTGIPPSIGSIGELGDVDVYTTPPTNGQVLLWDSATSNFIPGTVETGTDSAAIISLIDSAYVQARQAAQDFAYSSLTGAPTNVSSFTNDAGYLTTAIDSTGVTSLIDAAVAALVDTAPATLDTLNELAAALGDDANFATTVTTAIAAKLDSAQTIALIDSAYINARVSATDSAAVISIITDTVDSAYIQARTDAVGLMFRQFTYTADSGDTTFSGTDDNGSTLTYVAGKIEVFYNGVLLSPADYTATDGTTIVFDNPVDSADTVIVSSYTTTTALDSAAIINLATGVIDSAYINARVSATDSATVISLVTDTVDSAYVQARQTAQDFAYSSLTGAPTNISSFTNDAGYLTTAIDSTGVTTLIDAAVAALVDTAPATLDTLNELAAALGDDANFATTVTNAIAALPDSAEVATIVQSYGYTTTTVDSAAPANPSEGDFWFDDTNSGQLYIYENSAWTSTSIPPAFFDSANAIALIDSAYVQSRQTPQDFAYASLTGAPTNVSSFTNDANYLDSSTVTGVIDGTYINSLVAAGTDSATVVTLITSTVDSAYINARVSSTDSATVISLINSTIDSDFALGLVGASVSGVNTYEYTATASQTTFSGTDDNGATLAYTAGNILVHRNGILIVSTVDYVATNGTSVVLQSAADSGDTISVIAYQPTLVNASETTITSDVQTATSGQTSFTVAHTQGQILVFLNGILLKDTDDYVSNGSTVVLTQSADSGDQITVHNFAKYSAAGSGGGTNTSAVYAYSILFGA